MRVDKEAVLAALSAEDVANHIGIPSGEQRWRGRWMRSRRCGRTDHPSEAFGLARDGHWHCHSCDQGGDLLKLIAVAEGLVIERDFPRVLEIAAGIAGVEAEDEDDFLASAAPKPAPKPRPPPAPVESIEVREAKARKRAAWTWERLWEAGELDAPLTYLRSRGFAPEEAIQAWSLDEIRSTPIRVASQLQQLIDSGQADGDKRTLWWTFGTQPGTMSLVLPVRSVVDGAFVDLRARRYDPLPGQPKIVGMVGGVTVAPAEAGRPRRLLGCYGKPHDVWSDHVVIVEGLMDYLTAMVIWPNSQVLGAVEAGTLSLVAGHAARQVAQQGGTLTIVEQNDPPRILKDGRKVSGAADAAINEDPNSAAKVALRHLGPRRVKWLMCDGPDIKDLNDMKMRMKNEEIRARVVEIGDSVETFTEWRNSHGAAL